MRKPALPRFVLLLVLYAAIFGGLVYVQFARKTNFTLRAGSLVVQGNYRSNSGETSGIYTLSGEASVFFGGMEFILGEGLEFYGLSTRDNGRSGGAEGSSAGTPTLPQLMRVTDNEVSFSLIEGPELVFTTQYTGGSVELVIRADFSSLTDIPGLDDSIVTVSETEVPVNSTAAARGTGSYSLSIPFKPIRTSVIQQRGSQILIHSDGINYTFNRTTGENSVVLETQNPVINYRVLPDGETASPADFIISAALDGEQYEAAAALWLDQSYMLWNRSIAAGEAVSGELISAYMSEALKRGTYRAAVSAAAVWNPNNLFYEASPYIGRLDTATRALFTTEREQSTRLARVFNEKSPNFLRGFHIIEYLSVRAYDNLIEDAEEILRGFDPAEMTTAQAAGILEGRFDWRRYRPSRYNPFDRFFDQALFVVTGSMRKNPQEGSVLVFTKNNSGEEEADIELNLRLGRVLLRDEDETRQALGKTLILSVLSFADTSGAVPHTLLGNFTTNGERIASETVYRICFAGANYSRAQAAIPGIWAWTAATSFGGNASAGRLDLSFEFPAGETHYAIVRGIKPFATIQFNGTTRNQNSQFERQDTSGWMYSAAEQTLLLKIRPRQPIERITILY